MKIKGKGNSIIKTDNMAARIDEFIVQRSPIVPNGIEVRRIGRKVEQRATDIFHDFADTRGFMKRSIIYDDNLLETQLQT
jgi:hypothetical protein